MLPKNFFELSIHLEKIKVEKNQMRELFCQIHSISKFFNLKFLMYFSLLHPKNLKNILYKFFYKFRRYLEGKKNFVITEAEKIKDKGRSSFITLLFFAFLTPPHFLIFPLFYFFLSFFSLSRPSFSFSTFMKSCKEMNFASPPNAVPLILLLNLSATTS